eukprot:UN01243
MLQDIDVMFLYIFSGIFVFYSVIWFYGAYLRVQGIMAEVTGPPIILQDKECINYRWKEFPFEGFENPAPEHHYRKQSQAENMDDPTYLQMRTIRLP